MVAVMLENFHWRTEFVPYPIHNCQFSPAPSVAVLKRVLRYENIRIKQEFEAHWLGQGGAQGIRYLSRGRARTCERIAAEGSKADIAKPLKGLGPGVFQIAIRYRTDAWRVVYFVDSVGRLWVIHAFRKKSKIGIRAPKPDMDLIASRLARLKQKVGK